MPQYRPPRHSIDLTDNLVGLLDHRHLIAAHRHQICAECGDIGRLIGREYVSQFARAVRDAVVVKTDPKAVAKTRSELLNNGSN